jgi:hypothetical protein
LGTHGTCGSCDNEAAYQDDRVLFRFAGLGEFLRHELGVDQLGALADAVAAEVNGPVSQCPDYLLADEPAAERRFAELLGSSRTDA